MGDEKGSRDPLETGGTVDPPVVEARRGPSWRGWALSILAAIALSVAATLLLGGSGAFRPEWAAVSGGPESGCGGACCPPAIAGK